MNILKRPMIYAAFVCSIAAGISLFVMPLSFALIAVATIFLVCIAVFYKKYKYITVVLAIVLFTASLTSEFVKIDALKKCDGEKITGRFLITEEITDHETYNSIALKETSCDTIPNGIKLLAFDYDKSKLKMGDIINATLKLSIVSDYSQYRLSDYSNGIYATASVVELEKTGDCIQFYKIAGNIRKYVKKTVCPYFKGDTAGLLVALTTGDKTLLSDKFLGNIKTTGISHVVVVSGMHLAIIMAAIFWCADRLFYNKYIRSLLSVAFVISIFAVCGFTMSIIRAGSMFIISGLAPVFNRENDSLSSLLTAIVAVLISAPFAVFNISFQLSVLSTIAIIWVVPFYSRLIKEWFNVGSKFLKVLIDTFLCSTVAVVFTLPVTIKTFGYVSIVSALTNLAISYPVMISLIFNITAIIVSAVPVIKIFSTVLFFVSGICSRFMVMAVNTIAKLPITVAVLPKSAFWWSLALIAAVIGYMYYYEYKKKRSDLNANSI